MTATVRPGTGLRPLGPRLGSLAAQHSLLLAFLALLCVAAIWTPSFFDPANLRYTTRQASVLGIAALGQFAVLMVRGIDLSTSALVSFSAVLIASADPHAGRGLIEAFAVAALVGLVNAFLIVRLRVAPFIATFGMAVLVGGAQLARTRGSASASVPDSIVRLGQSQFLGVFYPVYVWLAVIAIAAIWLYRTRRGREMIMSGANPEMTKLSGLRTQGYVVLAFVVCAMLGTLSAVFLAGSAGYVGPGTGESLTLDAITAALLGGARFKGGEGSLFATAVGCLLLVSMSTVILLLGWSPQLQLIAKGLVLVLALVFQSRRAVGWQ
jgi:ribose/xylose/arabinose/galactoside ABC-type transport system permease subunit